MVQKSLAVLAGFPCEPIAGGVADVYAELKVSQEKKGLRLDENDLWIASIARFLNAVLVTSDRDFLRIEELRVEDWTR
ncbi:MAG: type II toxin-antitoxin system VapC family toxin [Phycisphaerales bacterium]|nr:type II toxin-antitoxin system VapC family toxin [Phycisphaerales bacterium]